MALLAGYFFDDRTRLNDFYYRAGHRIEERWSAQAVSGPRYGQHKPVYILTSKETFSAAEDFTYALKNLKRATVIGATTGGGANPGTDVRLTPHFAIFMPLGRAVSPITQANWEAIGVTPDIATPAGAALNTAELAILQKMASFEADPDTLVRLQARMAEIGRRAPGLEPAP